ncbi:MAG: anti-sigma factor [Polyangiaceae bacterium]
MVFTCSQLARSWGDIQDGQASAYTRRAADFHLAICARCRRYVAQLERLQGTLKSLKPEVDAPSEESLEHALGALDVAPSDVPDPSAG